MGSALVAALAWGATFTLVLTDGDDATIGCAAALAASASTASITLAALHAVRSASRAVQVAIRATIQQLADRVDGLEIGFEYGRRYAEIDRPPATVHRLHRG